MAEHEQTGLLPVLEIGGTHLTAALVRPGTWTVNAGGLMRVPFDGTRSADELISDMASVASALPAGHSGEWAVATPGPFDYEAGIGRFEDVGKFDALRGVNVRERLLAAVRPVPRRISFLNDADAFGVGEYATGAARGERRVVCITLGTGVGSAFLDAGAPVNEGPAVPPDGSAHLIVYRGRPLEETVSRRAIRAAYASATSRLGDDVPDVRDIADAARAGDATAARVFAETFAHLGRALAPWALAFEASMLIVGGSIATSWDLVEPAIRTGLGSVDRALHGLASRKPVNPEHAALTGAAFWAAQPR